MCLLILQVLLTPASSWSSGFFRQIPLPREHSAHSAGKACLTPLSHTMRIASEVGPNAGWWPGSPLMGFQVRRWLLFARNHFSVTEVIHFLHHLILTGCLSFPHALRPAGLCWILGLVYDGAGHLRLHLLPKNSLLRRHDDCEDRFVALFLQRHPIHLASWVSIKNVSTTGSKNL